MKGEMKGQGLNEKKMKEESSMKLSIGEIQKKIIPSQNNEK